jgi:hypothetical protein
MELTKHEIAERLMAATGNAENWDEVMTSVALIRVAALHLRSDVFIADRRGECANCGGTGRNPGSDYNDCTAPGCTAATERVELEKFVAGMGPGALQMDADAVIWAIHSRATEASTARIAHLTHERDTALRAVRLHTARIAELQTEVELLRRSAAHPSK